MLLLGVPTILLTFLMYTRGLFQLPIQDIPLQNAKPGVAVAPQSAKKSAPALNPATMTTSLGITHRVVCQPGYGGLNLRSAPGFTPPIAVIPCGQGVTVTGSPVWKQNEQWAPVIYGGYQGWSSVRLLQKV